MTKQLFNAPPRGLETAILDYNSPLELTRRLAHERILSEQMGGALPELTDLEGVHDVLDIACGPGGWALEVAKTCPHMQVTGIDMSPRLVNFARAQAYILALQNIRFQCMDAQGRLGFPDASFDLVNARFLAEFLSKSHWSPLLQECLRILRPGGIVCLSECEVGMSNSPAHEEMMGLMLTALDGSDRCFTPDGRQLGITLKLRSFLLRAGFEHIQTRSYHLDYSYGCPLHEPWTAGLLTLADLLRPFLVESGVATREEVGQKSQQMAAQMQSPQFCAFLTYITTWGAKPQG
jgi:SAM-dependent methyltransferase